MICFFFNDTATTEIYTLSLHDALPIWPGSTQLVRERPRIGRRHPVHGRDDPGDVQPLDLPFGLDRQSSRSEEHTSELQSRQYLVCRLLLEKKKKKHTSLHDMLYAHTQL